MRRRFLKMMAAASLTPGAAIAMPEPPMPDGRIREKGIKLYVSNSGDDSNNGLSAGSPFRTIKFAAEKVVADIDAAGAAPRIIIAAGTYIESVSISGLFPGANQIQFEGDSSNPAAVKWRAPDGQNCANVQDLAIATFTGIDFAAPGGVCLVGRQCAIVDVDRCRFGAASVHWSSTLSSTVQAIGAYTIYGNATYHVDANYAAACLLNGVQVTVANAINFTHFLRANLGGIVGCSGATFVGDGAGTNSAGARGLAAGNGLIDLGGSTVPGNSAFVTQTGGQVL